MATIVTRNAVSGPYGTWPSGVVVSGLPSHVANRMIESGDAEMSEDDLEPVMSKRNNLTGGVTSISTLTQSQYDALSPRDPSTLYIIVDGAAVDLDPPVFTSGAVAAAIDELSGAGQVIYTATSTDASLPVSYSLKPVGDYTAFSIGATSGAVTLIDRTYDTVPVCP